MNNNFSLGQKRSLMAQEEKEQRKVAGAVGLSLLALFAVMFGWKSVFLRFLNNFGIYEVFKSELNGNPAIDELFQILVSSVMLILPSFLLLRLTHNKASKIIEFSKPKTERTGAYIVAAFGFCMFSSQASAFLTNIFAAFGINFPSMEKELPNGILGFLLVFLSTVVFPSLLEEFMMRGVVLGTLRKFGDGFAIIASAFAFAIMHASLVQFAFTFLVGLCLGFVTVKTKSIWPAVIIHALNNFTSVVISYLGNALSEVTLNTVFLVFLLAVFAFSVFATLKVSENKDFLRLQKSETLSTESQKIGWFLSSPAMVTAIVIAFVIAIFLR